MAGREIIVVGASAGGVEALTALTRGLPADLPAAVFVVLHLPANGVSMLPEILERAGALEAGEARDGEPIHHRRIYVAPPDHHLLVRRDVISVMRGPRENGHRPAVDPLFRSAARAYGNRVIGVVLSGALDDGTAGLMAVKMRDGTAVVQDPADALFSGMPRSAIENVEVDYCLPLADIPAVVTRLAREEVREKGVRAVTDELDLETPGADRGADTSPDLESGGSPSAFSCPECGGTLWELHEGEVVRFRCHVGHAYSADSLASGQSEALEAALWTALRSLQEKQTLARRLADRATKRGHSRAAARFLEEAHDASHRAALVRQTLQVNESVSRLMSTGTEDARAPIEE